MTPVLERPSERVDDHDVDPFADRFLVCRVGTRRCALSIDHVIETMRPLPFEPLASAPEFVLGVAIIRGRAVPVVDAGTLLGSTESSATRLVTLLVEDRTVALAVDEVIGVSPMVDEAVHELPPLLEVATGAVIESLGVLDSELLIVLRESRLVPDSVWRLVTEAEPQ
jgi:purine-binding chemotaxis protein CheW